MHDERARERSRIPDLAALGCAALIGVLTLGPVTTDGGPAALASYAPTLADVVRNVALFLPLGIALALAGRTLAAIAAVGFGFSGAIELLQYFIPDRVPSLFDVAANGGGAVLGGLLAIGRAHWLAPRAACARALASLAALGICGGVLLTGWLWAPRLPIGIYYGGWTPELGGMDVYGGRVLEAAVGAIPIPVGGPAPDSRALREALEAGDPLRMRWQVGDAPSQLAPIVMVIGPRSEALLVAARGEDLVVRRWRRAADLGIEQPELTWRGALAGLTPGEFAGLRLTPTATGARLALDGRGERSLELGASRSWALFSPDRWLLPDLRPWLDALWIGALLVPLGLWMPIDLMGAAILSVTVLGLEVLPAWAGLAAPTLADRLAAIGGLVLGRLLRARQSQPQ